MTVELVLLMLLISFSLVLNVLFHSKKHVDTKETRLFGIVALVNLIGIIFELFAVLSIEYYGINSMFSIIVNKLYLVGLLCFGLVFSLFVLNATQLSSRKFDVFYEKLYKRITILIYVLFGLTFFGVCLLEINLFEGNDLAYSYGDAVNLVFNVYQLCAFCYFASLLINIGNIKNNKRNIPTIVFIVIVIVSVYLTKNYPGMLFMAALETLVVFLMYHTIENPDVDMLEQLGIAKKEVNKANRAKMDFLSNMSHEIRTPLNSIVGFSDCLLDTDDVEEIKSNAEDIINASESLLGVVNGILDGSRIEAGNIEIENSSYNSYETFNSVAELIAPKMKNKGIDFKYYIAPDLPKTLYGDSNSIKKIISNLLINGCKYTNDGFVKYDVSCVNTGDYVKLIISVEDTGVGIKRQDLDKIFTKLQRLDVDDVSKSDDSGLGLAVIKQLTEMMGGKVIVHSELGKGSIFTILINQCIVEEEVKAPEVKYNKMLDLSNVKILLVDDNNLNLKVTSKILEKYNANNITMCGSGFECLDLIKSGNTFDIIFLDDMMPKMTGVETLKKLKEIEGFKIPVVALTANAILGMKDKYIEAGFDDYLSKPINKSLLIEVLNKILIKSVTDSSNSLNNVQEKKEKKYPDVIPIDDAFTYKIGNKMCLSSEKDLLEEKKEDIENEKVIERFLENHKNFELVDSGVSFGRKALDKAVRILPCDGGEGHFVAKLKKSGELITSPTTDVTPCKFSERETVLKLYDETLKTRVFGENFQKIGDKIILLPNMALPPLSGLGVIRAGILFGEIKKNRVEPCHALYMAAKKDDLKSYIDLDYNDSRLQKFYHGEEIDVDQSLKGFTAVLVEGVSTGFGKANGGTLKNRYPKGLRSMK